MKIPISQVVSVLEVAELFQNQKLSIKTAYALTKLFSRANEEYKFYKNKLQEIIEKYAQRDENGEKILLDDGKSISIDKDFTDACSKELDELQNFEIEMPELLFSLDDFNGVNLTIEELQPLMPFIKDN